MPFPFKFLRGKAAGALGSGADGLALQQFQSLPVFEVRGAGVMVQRSFAPYSGAYIKTSIQGPTDDIIGNGLSLHEQLVLAGLSKLS